MSANKFVDIEAMKGIPYSKVVGCFIHAMTITRIDLAYSNGEVSKYIANPDLVHWSPIKWIVQYIKTNLDFKITYKHGAKHPAYSYEIQA